MNLEEEIKRFKSYKSSQGSRGLYYAYLGFYIEKKRMDKVSFAIKNKKQFLISGRSVN